VAVFGAAFFSPTGPQTPSRFGCWITHSTTHVDDIVRNTEALGGCRLNPTAREERIDASP
jgi:hypothetical protein